MNKVLRSNIFFLVIALLISFGQYLLAVIMRTLRLPGYLGTPLIEILFLFIPSLIFLLAIKEPIRKTLRLNPIKPITIIYLILIVAFSMPIMSFLNLLTQLFFHNNVADAMQNMSKLNYIVYMLIIALTPAVCEEITMRGAVFSGYRNVSIHKAALMNGFLFGVFHMNPPQFLYAMALGIIFTYVVYATNSIFSSMIMHFCINGYSATVGILTMKSSHEAAKNIEFSQLPTVQIVSTLIFFFILASIGVFVVKMLINILLKEKAKNEALEVSSPNWNKLENIESNQGKQRVINWPVYASVVVYFAFVIFIRYGGLKWLRMFIEVYGFKQ